MTAAQWFAHAEREAAGTGFTAAQLLAEWLALADRGASPGFLRLPPHKPAPTPKPAVKPL